MACRVDRSGGLRRACRTDGPTDGANSGVPIDTGSSGGPTGPLSQETDNLFGKIAVLLLVQEAVAQIRVGESGGHELTIVSLSIFNRKLGRHATTNVTRRHTIRTHRHATPPGRESATYPPPPPMRYQTTVPIIVANLSGPLGLVLLIR